MIPLALVRHGPTAWNEQHRLQGQTDIPLSDEGRARVGRWTIPPEFTEFDWVASPLSRAQETASILGLIPDPETAIVEMHWGDWEGQTHIELKEKYGEEFDRRAAKGIDLRPHGGESPRDVRARVAEWAKRLAATGRPTGAVAHQGIIRAAISLATGWDMRNPAPEKMDWDSLHLFRIDDDGAVTIERLNISLLDHDRASK
jgi:probable phosphoglycerate mutase